MRVFTNYLRKQSCKLKICEPGGTHFTISSNSIQFLAQYNRLEIHDKVSNWNNRLSLIVLIDIPPYHRIHRRNQRHPRPKSKVLYLIALIRVLEQIISHMIAKT